MLHGAIAAALTPLTGGGTAPDEEAVGPYVDFLASHGVDGILALGTTGEGVLFDLAVRRRSAARFEPYLLEGLDIFVGPEALIPQGFARGAARAVSGLAASFPDAVVALVREPTPEAGERVGALRASLQALPFHAASKTALAFRGVPVRPGVRRPLRDPPDRERDAGERIVREWAA